MITMPSILEASLFIASVLCIWAVWSWGLKPSLLNGFRQSIFAIRDEMFDYAADGGIDFNHPAYGTLRTIMNGYLRFAHRIPDLSFIVFVLLFERKKSKGIHQNFMEKLEGEMRTLDWETKEKMSQYLKRTGVEVLKYMAFTSPLMLLVVIPILLIAIIGALLHGSLVKSKNILVESIEPLNETAFSEGKRSATI